MSLLAVATVRVSVLVAVAVLVGVSSSLITLWLARRRTADSLSRLVTVLDDRNGDLTRLELRNSRFVRALDAVAQGMVIFDEHGVVVYRNRVAEAFRSGRHSDLLVKQAVDELGVAGTATESLNGSTTGVTTRALDLFGPPRRHLVLTALPLSGEPPAGTLVVVDDVSERQRLDAMRRDFVANISHELKTPVSALALLAETLADEDDPLVLRRLTGRMLREAERVGHTIDDLLELSRLEAAGLPSLAPVSVQTVLAEAADRIRPGAAVAGVAIEVYPPPQPLEVAGDRRQLTSAVYNLLENSVKYSDKGSVVEVSAALEGSTVVLAVQDHGIGIPARDLERIFERFYRVDRARSRQTGGTGLGLAIVRHVAANHHGEAAVSSHEGEGSTFTLRLPLREAGHSTGGVG